MQILGPVNEKNGGKIEGAEFAYQTFFDFLPGLWSGLGMQANYTYVNQIDIHNSNLVDVGGLTAGGVGRVRRGERGRRGRRDRLPQTGGGFHQYLQSRGTV